MLNHVHAPFVSLCGIHIKSNKANTKAQNIIMKFFHSNIDVTNSN